MTPDDHQVVDQQAQEGLPALRPIAAGTECRTQPALALGPVRAMCQRCPYASWSKAVTISRRWAPLGSFSLGRPWPAAMVVWASEAVAYEVVIALGVVAGISQQVGKGLVAIGLSDSWQE